MIPSYPCRITVRDVSTTRNTRNEVMVPVAFRARPSDVERYREIVERDERTLGSALRFHIRQVIEDAEGEREQAA